METQGPLWSNRAIPALRRRAESGGAKIGISAARKARCPPPFKFAICKARRETTRGLEGSAPNPWPCLANAISPAPGIPATRQKAQQARRGLCKSRAERPIATTAAIQWPARPKHNAEQVLPNGCRRGAVRGRHECCLRPTAYGFRRRGLAANQRLSYWVAGKKPHPKIGPPNRHAPDDIADAPVPAGSTGQQIPSHTEQPQYRNLPAKNAGPE